MLYSLALCSLKGQHCLYGFAICQWCRFMCQSLPSWTRYKQEPHELSAAQKCLRHGSNREACTHPPLQKLHKRVCMRERAGSTIFIASTLTAKFRQCLIIKPHCFIMILDFKRVKHLKSATLNCHSCGYYVLKTGNKGR